MFKNIIAPIQAWLLATGRCVGCGTPLSKGQKISLDSETEKIICKCGRIFIHDIKTNKYRRALAKEM